MSRTAGYEQVRLGEFPVPTFRVGRKIKVPRSGILERLGVTAGTVDLESVSLLREISDRLAQLVELTEVRAISAPPGEQVAAEMLQARGWHVVPPRGYRLAAQRPH